MLRIGAVLLIASVHGFAIAATACAMGDSGPRYDDRLTLNPLRHIDPIGGLLTVLFTVGWIRPVAVDPGRLRAGQAGLLAMVVGASCATIALAVLLRLMRAFVLNMLPDTAAATLFVFVETVGQLCVSFTVFNLLPLPLLSGQHILVAVLPQRRDTLRRAQPYFAVLLALLIATGVVARLLAPAEAAIARVIWDG
ncbi:MAG: site-2 protease family protein [Acetobacteraceae bacterium]